MQTGVVVVPPDIINKECFLKIDRLTDDEINAWTKKEIVPEFPLFVEGREIGGYTMRLKAKPAHPRYNTHLKRNRTSCSYENLDNMEEKSDDEDTKRTKRKPKSVPKNGPSVDHIAAHKFYLHSSVKNNPMKEKVPDSSDTQESKTPSQPREVLTTKDTLVPPALPEPEPNQPKGKLVVT